MNSIVMALLLMNPNPHAVPAYLLGPAIVKIGKVYHISPVLLTQIILVESAGDPMAHNSNSDDHGLMQINRQTAAMYHISYDCLYNWKCNLQHGAYIVSKLRRPCAYNLGNNGSKNKTKIKLCLTYERKLDKIILKLTEAKNGI
jgi:soluble lytic murein transglycosylase-like protein